MNVNIYVDRLPEIFGKPVHYMDNSCNNVSEVAGNLHIPKKANLIKSIVAPFLTKRN